MRGLMRCGMLVVPDALQLMRAGDGKEGGIILSEGRK